jgi:PST family polysaccharide transporter
LLKYLALQFSPSAFGLLTQVMGVAATFYMFAGGGVTIGLIRNLSASESEEERRGWMRAGSAINALASLGLAIVALALALLAGAATFGHPSYGLVYLGIAVAQAVVGLGNLVLAYFTGIGDSRTFALVHIASNILSPLLLIALAQGLGFVGAILGLVLGPAIVGIVGLWQLRRHAGDWTMLRTAWERPLLKDLLSYATAMACAVTAVPLAQLLIRIDMSERLGWESVGYWQAVAKLSDAYMLFIGVLLINHLLPQLARRREDASALSALVRLGTPLVGIFILAGSAMYLARDYVILITYSRAFLPASELVLPQVIGDTLRVAALLLYYYFMSRGRIVVTIVAELTQGVTLYIFYFLFVPSHAAMAPVYGHVATCALFVMLMIGVLHFSKRPARSLAP